MVKAASTIETPRAGLARVKDAMQFLSCGRTKLNELMAKGVLPKVRLAGSRSIRVRWEDLHRLAAGGE